MTRKRAKKLLMGRYMIQRDRAEIILNFRRKNESYDKFIGEKVDKAYWFCSDFIPKIVPAISGFLVDVAAACEAFAERASDDRSPVYYWK